MPCKRADDDDDGDERDQKVEVVHGLSSLELVAMTLYARVLADRRLHCTRLSPIEPNAILAQVAAASGAKYGTSRGQLLPQRRRMYQAAALEQVEEHLPVGAALAPRPHRPVDRLGQARVVDEACRPSPRSVAAGST